MCFKIYEALQEANYKTSLKIVVLLITTAGYARILRRSVQKT